MQNYLIKNATIINEGETFQGSVFIENGRIKKIHKGNISTEQIVKNYTIIDAQGKFLIPGVIDVHVHFREPGLTHKADINSESRAAVASGVTSFFEMPNTIPNAVTIDILEEKYKIASRNSFANYSFFLGATNNNLEEILKADTSKICGVKVFIGSSTGNLLVDDRSVLEKIFSLSKLPVAVHSEDEEIINKNTVIYKSQFGENIPIQYHSKIRNNEACIRATELAVTLAEQYNTRLHITHLSTADEVELLKKSNKKNISSEVCVPHLFFNDTDYEKLEGKIKINPSVKSIHDQKALLNALSEDIIDIISTDHAPHTLEEKQNSYFKCPSGTPSIQHSLPAILELYHNNTLSLEKIIEKMCHNPATLFNIEKRGFIRENYFADLVILDLKAPWKVNESNIYHKCGWSVMEDWTFKSKILKTFVNGNLVFDNGNFNEQARGSRITFNRT